jgi:hypothetical protein
MQSHCCYTDEHIHFGSHVEVPNLVRASAKFRRSLIGALVRSLCWGHFICSQGRSTPKDEDDLELRNMKEMQTGTMT